MPAHRFAGVSENEFTVRSLMMRLYRSYRDGETFYPAQFVNGEAPELQARGWIERHDYGWKITEKGIQAWARMIGPGLLLYHLRRRGGHYDEATELLEKVEGMTTKTCSQTGFENPRMISRLGRELSMCEVHQKAYWKSQRLKTTGKETAADMVSVPPTEPISEVHNCDSCIYREIIDILRRRNPKIDALVLSMEEQRRLLEELGL